MMHLPNLERLCWLVVVGMALWCGYQLGWMKVSLEALR